MKNNIFTPQLVDVILPGCSIDDKVTKKLSDIRGIQKTKVSAVDEPNKDHE